MKEQKLTLKKQVGQAAEHFARDYLVSKGLSFVQSNFYCKQGEIDLIMKERDSLVFVEVRYRSSSAFGSAAESVTYPKQQKVLRAAEYYLMQHRIPNHFCRFDVIGIAGNQKEVEWIKDAFGADGW